MVLCHFTQGLVLAATDCIPLDPYYLSAKARELDFHTKFIELALDINEQMPYYAADRIAEAVNGLGGKLILVLGITYKRDVADVRESPALKLIDILRSKQAIVGWHDPFYPRESASLQAGMHAADCVVIAVDHSVYNWQDVVDSSRLVFDCRGVTRHLVGNNIVRL